MAEAAARQQKTEMLARLYDGKLRLERRNGAPNIYAGPIGAIVKGAEEADPDYTKIAAPALAFFTIYGAPHIPTDADAALRARLVQRWDDYGNPFQRQKVDHFRRDMKYGQVIELRTRTTVTS
jgi:hypothetical protein